jgi:hypothetical protein
MPDDKPTKRTSGRFEQIRDPHGLGGQRDAQGNYVVRNVTKANRRQQQPGGDVARGHDTDPFEE